MGSDLEKKIKKTKSSGYWQDENNIWEELNCVISKLGGCFPIQKELLKLKRSDISNAVGYHGGMGTLREKMGYNLIKKPNNYWKEFDNIEKPLTKIISDLGYFPTQKELSEMGESSLMAAIKNHGGLNVIREKLGYKLSRQIGGHWKNKNNIDKEVIKIISDLGHFPTGTELRRMGRSDLDNAIVRYYGGTNGLRKKMGYKLDGNPSGYWKEFDNIKKPLTKIISDLGHFPIQRELVEIKRFDLTSAIASYHGGINAVREKMGYLPRNIKEKHIDNLTKEVANSDAVKTIYDLAKSSGINRDMAFCFSEIICANNPELLTRRMQVSGKLGKYFEGTGSGGSVSYSPENAIDALEDLFRAKGILANPPRDSLEPLIEIVRATYDKKYGGQDVVMSEIVGRDMGRVEMVGVRDILREVKQDYKFDERMDREVYGKKIHATVKRPVLR